MKNFIQGQPIIIGLAGKAGSGKTSVAESIVPKGSFDTSKYGMKWDHLFYALPLYEMASIKKNTLGHNSELRKLYALHDVLYEIYGRSTLANIPHYYSFVEKVKEIYELNIEPEGIKPRTFLQKAGDICREHDPNCFANWAIIKSNLLYRQYIKDLIKSDSEDNIVPMCILISDVRYVNEAKSILKQPNGIVITFDAQQDVLNERIMKRDGKLMNAEQLSHSSEQQIDEIKEISSAIINTDNMTLEEQVEATLNSLGIGTKTNA
jgi:dephospho-CoA kinase